MKPLKNILMTLLALVTLAISALGGLASLVAAAFCDHIESPAETFFVMLVMALLLLCGLTVLISGIAVCYYAGRLLFNKKFDDPFRSLDSFGLSDRWRKRFNPEIILPLALLIFLALIAAVVLTIFFIMQG